MKKYVVICYSVHNKKIASHDIFENKEDAYAFLKKDAQDTYEEEMIYCGDKEEWVNLEIHEDGTAYLSSCHGEYEWTWEVIEV